MIKLKKENAILETVFLEKGVDYSEEDLIGNAFVGDKLKELPADFLTAAAKKFGFDKWEWCGHESNNKIKVVFKKTVSSAYVCSICHEVFTGYGNNPYPYEGECCCDRCNLEYVAPARLNLKNEKENEK